MVGWFLITAGRQRDPEEAEGLDGSLHELASTSSGPLLLLGLAAGLVTFGLYRLIDAYVRKPSEITTA